MLREVRRCTSRADVQHQAEQVHIRGQLNPNPKPKVERGAHAGLVLNIRLSRCTYYTYKGSVQQLSRCTYYTYKASVQQLSRCTHIVDVEQLSRCTRKGC